jgi:hypothetical protein
MIGKTQRDLLEAETEASEKQALVIEVSPLSNNI